jgi:ribonuclease P protein component
MINRKHRFHGYGSLRFVYKNGSTVRGQFGAIKYVKNPHRADYRMAVVVSRKVHKSAVVRNRIRRRIFEVVRKNESSIVQSYDMVFTVFSDQLAALDAAELQERILDKMQEAGIIAGKNT